MRDLPFVVAVLLVTASTASSSLLVSRRDESVSHPLSVSVDWNSTVCTCQTISTLQVVMNPLLNPKQYPFVDKMWSYLKALNAEYVRVQGWSPYPQWGVAELKPPNPETKETFWDFSGMVMMLGPFMDSVQSAVWDFSTMPDWFISSHYNVTTYLEPNRSSHVDWNYQSGTFQPNTSWLAAKYYGRVAKYLIDGWMIDEFGHNISGGPAYGLDKVKYWEVLNEPDMGFLTPPQYTSIFDAVVQEVRAQADPTHKVKFQGLALALQYEYDKWYRPFLTERTHMAASWDAVNSISFHFYAVPPHHTINRTWTYGLFEQLEGFVEEVRVIKGIRDEMSPSTKMSIDEFGTILPGQYPHPSDLYFNAANGVYAVGYGEMSELGLFLLGCSQFAGTPALPEYGWHSSQYPSVSMMNWTNGEPNARYWGLKLVLEEFAVGDEIVKLHRPPRNKICAARGDYLVGSGPLTASQTPMYVSLSCPEPGSFISSFGKVDMLDQVGSCNEGWDILDRNCSDNSTLLAAVTKKCLGQQYCQVSWSDMTFWRNGENVSSCGHPDDTMVIEAYCSGNTKGYATPSGYMEDRIYLQARHTVDGKKKILFVNKNNDYVTLHLPEMVGATARIIDSYMEARSEVVEGTTLLLRPFAMGVLILAE